MYAISFVIVSNGQRLDLINNSIRVIKDLNIKKYEIIIIGKYNGATNLNTTIIQQPQLVEQALIGKMRNIAFEKAKYNTICSLDDDVVLDHKWYENFKTHCPRRAHIVGFRVINKQWGGRFWDWSDAEIVNGEVQEPRLKQYFEHANINTYVGGGAMILNKKMTETVKYDENCPIYKHEDVRFCKRAIEMGYNISFCQYMECVHYVDQRGRNKLMKR